MKNVVYISYTGMLEPLGQSQVIAYLKNLHTKGCYTFILISYEKASDYDQKQVVFLKEHLAVHGILWLPLRYHHRPTALATLFDILIGCLWVWYFVLSHKVDIVHVRSYIPMLIALPVRVLLKKPVIFDMRGLWADERADAGENSRDGYEYKAIKKLEHLGVRYASQIVVLTERAKYEIAQLYNRPLEDFTVIPCCVQLDSYYRNLEARQRIRKLQGWNNKRVLVYSGSLGGLYPTEEIVRFFSICLQHDASIHMLFLTRGSQQVLETYLATYQIPKETYTIHSALPNEVTQWLSTCDGAICFVEPTYSKLASSPTKFAEYLACGLPVIINTGIGDLDLQVNLYAVGSLISHWSEKEYHAAWQHFKVLLNDSTIHNNCRKCAEELYSLEHGINRYLSIYSRIVG